MSTPEQSSAAPAERDPRSSVAMGTKGIPRFQLSSRTVLFVAVFVIGGAFLMLGKRQKEAAPPAVTAPQEEPFKPAPKRVAASTSALVAAERGRAPEDAAARLQAERQARLEAERQQKEADRKARMRAPLLTAGNAPETPAWTDAGTAQAQAPAVKPPLPAAGSGMTPGSEGAVRDNPFQTARSSLTGEGAGSAVRGASGSATAGASPHAFLDATTRRPASRGIAAKPETDLDYKIFEGKLISAVMETAVDTTLPGSVRAMVDHDVYGEQGRVILIPRMTRLIGEVNSTIQVGQARAMLVWKRAVLPNGASINLASYATDSLGRSGVVSEVDRRLLERFGPTALLTLVGAAATANMNAIGDTTLLGDMYRYEMLQAVRRESSNLLAAQANIPPTIYVHQGTRVHVYLARDLDFTPLRGALEVRNE